MASSRLRVDGDELVWGDRRVPTDRVRRFAERVSPWSGAAWLEVEGPGWRVPIDADYGVSRAALRRALHAVPFDADWQDGRFPARPLGLPEGVAMGVGLLAALAAVIAVAILAGPAGAVAVGVIGAWPVVRLRDRVVVRDEGLVAGPPWAPSLPWHEVEGAQAALGRWGTRVWVSSSRGVFAATLPTAIVPALRARLWRLGGVKLEDARLEGLDATYAVWRVPAAGIPWGLLVGTVCVAPWTGRPWVALLAGLTAMTGTALLGAAVEARGTGWGAGAVLWATLTYAVVLAALTLGWSLTT